MSELLGLQSLHFAPIEIRLVIKSGIFVHTFMKYWGLRVLLF